MQLALHGVGFRPAHAIVIAISLNVEHYTPWQAALKTSIVDWLKWLRLGITYAKGIKKDIAEGRLPPLSAEGNGKHCSPSLVTAQRSSGQQASQSCLRVATPRSMRFDKNRGLTRMSGRNTSMHSTRNTDRRRTSSSADIAASSADTAILISVRIRCALDC